MPPSIEEWALIRDSYCTTSEPAGAIATRFGIHHTAITRYRLINKWPLRPAQGAPSSSTSAAHDAKPITPAPMEPASTPPGNQTLPRTSVAREALVYRIYEALTLKLSKLEQQMNSEKEFDPIDQERQSRALNSIVRSFERTTEFDPAYTRTGPAFAAAPATDTPGAGSGSAAAHPPANPDAASAEHLRRDIAERLGRILERRNTPGNTC